MGGCAEDAGPRRSSVHCFPSMAEAYLVDRLKQLAHELEVERCLTLHCIPWESSTG